MGFLSSCFSKKSTKDEIPLFKSYLSERHQTEILDIKVQRSNRMEHMFKKTPYRYVTYSSPDLGNRNGILQCDLENGQITPRIDNFSKEYLSLLADHAIEQEGGEIPFTIYNRFFTSGSNLLSQNDWNRKNYSNTELKNKIFKNSKFQTLVIVTAPDILTNKKKYEEFHIEIMRRMKAQGIEGAELQFYFLDDKIEIRDHRLSPAQPIISTTAISPHILQRWRSIHSIKWYDMVKDHPDKVLKYGKVYDK